MIYKQNQMQNMLQMQENNLNLCSYNSLNPSPFFMENSNQNDFKPKYRPMINNNEMNLINYEKNNDENNNKYEKIYEIFEEKFKSSLNNKIKGRHVLDTDSAESTKLSFNNRKGKFNYNVTGEKKILRNYNKQQNEKINLMIERLKYLIKINIDNYYQKAVFEKEKNYSNHNNNSNSNSNNNNVIETFISERNYKIPSMKKTILNYNRRNFNKKKKKNLKIF